MKFSEKWLHEWVNCTLNSQQLTDKLTMAGLEVDSVTPVCPPFHSVVVGKTLAISQHPNADRLSVCTVEIGKEQPVTIVCGDPKVKVNTKYPVALIGAELPGDIKIKQSKLRGVESFGMLCSSTELGLADGTQGIMILPEDAPIGTDFRRYLELDDLIFDVDLTPNRGDCLSIKGLAREVATICDLTFNPAVIETILPKITDTLAIDLQAPLVCPRYAGRVIKNINPKASTPLYMKERLRRSGLRAIHPVVDVTNYVMLELGQPMHAFDLQQISGSIQVRHGRNNEQLKLLDESLIGLDPNYLVIADESKPLALAGVMGGAESAVQEQTQHIFLESAFFEPSAISTSVQHYLIHSDSSHRFERGVDHNLQVQAIERATHLLLEIVGGEPGPVIEQVAKEFLPKPVNLSLRKSRIQRILGIIIDDQIVEDILKRLGMSLTSSEQGWEVKVPSFRFDIGLEIDLIEEIARVYDYDRIETSQPYSQNLGYDLPEEKLSIKTIRQLMTSLGYHEAITYSFVDGKIQQKLFPDLKAIPLSNPLSADLSVMRTSILPGLLATLAYNQKRQQPRVRYFESGLCFYLDQDEIKQVNKVAGVLSGSAFPTQWGIASRPVDYFDAKGDVETLLELSRSLESVTFERLNLPVLHPHQSAAIIKSGHVIGYVGLLHPSVLQLLDLKGPIVAFELELSAVEAARLPSFTPLSKFPLIRRDLALIVAKSLPADEIKKKITQNVSNLLHEVEIFDIYQGEGIDVAKKSVALGLTFQHPSRTLVDDEVNTIMQQLITQLETELDAKLR